MLVRLLPVCDHAFNNPVLVGTYLLLFKFVQFANNHVQVREIDLYIEGLHSSLEGFKLAHISDIHYNAGRDHSIGTTPSAMKEGT